MKYDLEDRLVEYAVTMIDTMEELPGTRAGNHMSNQLVRPCTSPALSRSEAQDTESRKDFIQKMKMSLKELNDTRVWLGIILRKAFMQRAEKVELELSDCQELIRILAKRIVKAESKKA